MKLVGILSVILVFMLSVSAHESLKKPEFTKMKDKHNKRENMEMDPMLMMLLLDSDSSDPCNGACKRCPDNSVGRSLLPLLLLGSDSDSSNSKQVEPELCNGACKQCPNNSAGKKH